MPFLDDKHPVPFISYADDFNLITLHHHFLQFGMNILHIATSRVRMVVTSLKTKWVRF